MEDYNTPPQAAEFVIADPPLEVDPAAGTGDTYDKARKFLAEQQKGEQTDED